MAQSYFPLRWESTGDQWWYASPIDWAAANGHYELVRELLHLDANLLIKLTSLRRIRRLETVWDDDTQFIDAAKCRSFVARNLLHECETKNNKNSLIRAGYGGWLLYTAASAGDIGFVHELLERDPLLVFGEGEYGVTDIFYAAARGKSTEVFRLIFANAVSPRCLVDGEGDIEGRERRGGGNGSVFRWEIVNRAVLASARGGNLEVLKELVGDCSDILAYRDNQGSTILHAAAGRGQVKVVNDLIASFNIIESRDNQGNTALHIAAFRGHLPIVEALVHASPFLPCFKNNAGDTFLHMAIAGFRTPGFRRLDRQMELMKQLIYGSIFNINEIINIQNNDGRTALHVAVIGDLQCNLVEVLITVPSIKLNTQDINGMTPLDLLNRRPHSASSEILIKLLVSSGGLSYSKDLKDKAAIFWPLKMQSGIGNSPGTSFRISDAEIFLHTGIDASEASGRPSSSSSTGKNDFPHTYFEPIEEKNEHADRKKASSSVNSAARRLKVLLRWPRCKDTKTDDDSVSLLKKWSEREETPTPLRERFLKPQSSVINNKRTLAVRTSMPSPATKKKFAAGLMHGVIQAMPHLAPSQSRMPVSPSSSSLVPSPALEMRKGVCEEDEEICDTACSNVTGSSSQGSSLKNAKLMNQYFCFGAQGFAVDGSSINQRQSRFFGGRVPPVS
ncbi:serine/threonine-protein phosphatase 6 regulatory ankyrin repeat subunit B-like [Phalaenopsis equestris]|uniref:serine/threonine-protein phosphatase 6 regulatory ankyrin repeat subunit B-like n=1 Tax=Phalaenopsis equestris TaxID=78828 RepID=UPI0009E41E17|nr:serine/threonine-protein phosphatase 6 regulatory ankyrin repeat subunit B-like [Phalaenopsis equestris]XP_020574908.1 serine/threonine-protein phosphatase 6 regulatory ankyrin repeat subunit B-like [Phalaenopsis equestris]